MASPQNLSSSPHQLLWASSQLVSAASGFILCSWGSTPIQFHQRILHGGLPAADRQLGSHDADGTVPRPTSALRSSSCLDPVCSLVTGFKLPPGSQPSSGRPCKKHMYSTSWCVVCFYYFGSCVLPAHRWSIWISVFEDTAFSVIFWACSLCSLPCVSDWWSSNQQLFCHSFTWFFCFW